MSNQPTGQLNIVSHADIKAAIDQSGLAGKELLRLSAVELKSQLKIADADERYVQTITERIGRKRLEEENDKTINTITNLLKADFPSVFVMHKTLFGQEAFIVFPDGDPAAEVQP